MKASQIIAVVTRSTRLQGLMRKRATGGFAEFALRQVRSHERARRAAAAEERPQAKVVDEVVLDAMEAAAGYAEYEDEDAALKNTLRQLKIDLDLGYPVTFVDRTLLANFDFGRCLAVVVVGQDGLVANTAKYVGDVPVVGVNPDPARNDGVLLPFAPDQARSAVQRVLARSARIRNVTLAEVNTNDGQQMLAFNDFFIGCSGHASARYTLQVAGRAEVQSSSGIIVSTGAGSTGWLSSLFNMNHGFVIWLGGTPGSPPKLTWEDRKLAWAVREPFASKHSGATLVAGLLPEEDEMVIESLQPAGGVIFSDGVEQDFLEFNSGTVARVSVSSKQAKLVVG